MGKTSLYIGLAILSIGLNQQLSAKNLLPNGSMTKGKDKPEGWNTWAKNPEKAPVISRDTTVKAKGAASLCVSGTAQTDGNANINLKGLAGKTVTITGQFRYEGNPQKAEVVMFAQGGKKLWEVIINKKFSAGPGKWKDFTKTVKIPGNSKRVMLMVYLKGAGKVCLDEIAINKGSLPPLNRKRTCKDPKIIHVGPVSPDILAIKVHDLKVIVPPAVPYIQETEDEPVKRTLDENGHQLKHPGYLKRNGKQIGAVIGPNFDLFQAWDKIDGIPLDTQRADNPLAYLIVSEDDPNYQAPQEPVKVMRKSKPRNLARTGSWKFAWPKEHNIYLQLPKPLKPGKTYTIKFPGVNMNVEEITYKHEPKSIRSEAIHMSQIGFRPDDPVKRAYLSLWMGNGGPNKSYKADMPFEVIDTKTGQAAFTGKTQLHRKATDPDGGREQVNNEKTDVFIMDFSDLNKPGSYRVVVNGVGSSYPFEISENTWTNAFKTSARGFYHQRSGIELKAPYTTFKRPRVFHPADGVKVYQTTLRQDEGGFNQGGVFKALVEAATDEVVPEAWGGYFDAGDWDRRVQHLKPSCLKLELLELFPDFFAKVDLNIPESSNKLPDLLDEALWNIDFFRRLQKNHGGIPHGIESAEHPNFGETSSTESLKVMLFAPDVKSSYAFAGAAAKAAIVLKKFAPEKVKEYEESALKAMNWAEAEREGSLARIAAKGRTRKGNYPFFNDQRNLAALELYRLTDDKKWHDIFLETTPLKNEDNLFLWKQYDTRDAAFIYAMMPDEKTDSNIKAKAIQGIIDEANSAVKYANQTAFNWASPDWGRHFGYGLATTPDAESLIRAHVLTEKPEYLKAAILACQAGLGANPANLCYTTGVGKNWPQNILCADARFSQQPDYPGITVYGPMRVDVPPNKLYWRIKTLKNECTPSAEKWPNIEAFFDVYSNPGQCEWTVMQTMGPTMYAWGYLAARDKK